MRALLPIVVLASCAPALPPNIVELDDYLTVDYQSGVPHQDEEIKVAMEGLRKFAHEKCGIKLLCAYLAVKPDVFQCGNVDRALGCYPFSGHCIMQYKHYDNLWESAMVHEVMHHIYYQCTGNAGTDYKGDHTPEFLADVEKIDARVETRIKVRWMVP